MRTNSDRSRQRPEESRDRRRHLPYRGARPRSVRPVAGGETDGRGRRPDRDELELGRGGREVEYTAAFALALSGDLPQSRTLAQELAREFPEDTSVQVMYLPALRGLFSLNIPTPVSATAIQSLQAASRYDLALGRIGFVGRFGGLYPIYVPGLAHLAARQPAEAAAEFQRILYHRSMVLVDPMDALARLQLARALVLSGDTVKAKSAYHDLLTLWRMPTPRFRFSRKQGQNMCNFRKLGVGKPQSLNMPQPTDHRIPTGASLVHQHPQVVAVQWFARQWPRETSPRTARPHFVYPPPSRPGRSCAVA